MTGMTGMMENTFINVKNHSSTITAEIDVPQGGAEGVVFAQGGRFAASYLKDGKPTYSYNWDGLERCTVASPQALAPGKASIKLELHRKAVFCGGENAGVDDFVEEGRIGCVSAFADGGDSQVERPLRYLRIRASFLGASAVWP
ncbi:hypothetical protein QTI33_15265 [Variovorax sp. J22P271]|uniref:hypothetical protein n=1 Tax=Variovorax davisae TaxID=3053515 RepID=UPI002577B0FC|nr:hypothetical protein [Variovorax sp. J22P271]MDM0033493.1 hypothetical protein [Variovorax sp. J22P271]